MRHVSVSPVKLTLNKQHEQGTKKKNHSVLNGEILEFLTLQ